MLLHTLHVQAFQGEFPGLPSGWLLNSSSEAGRLAQNLGEELTEVHSSTESELSIPGHQNLTHF